MSVQATLLSRGSELINCAFDTGPAQHNSYLLAVFHLQKTQYLGVLRKISTSVLPKMVVLGLKISGF